MPAVVPEELLTVSEATSLPLDALNDRLAEAARYAVLQRLMPVLRHDMAGSLQPVRLLLKLLERRLQMPEPDLQAIARNINSISSLTQQSSVDCMNTLQWMASGQNTHVSLRDSVDEAIKMLTVELSVRALDLVNGIADDTATAPQGFLRSAFMGALLAFCDQSAASGILQVTFNAFPEGENHPGQLKLQLLPDGTGKTPASLETERKSRWIDWPDVDAMATSFGVKLARGNGWLTLDLPKP